MAGVRPFRSGPGAASAAFVWLCGTVLLPAVHLALHTLPHDHEGGGIHYHLDADPHDDHDDHDDDDPGGPPTVEAPHGHHHGHAPHAAGLAHFASATGDGAAGAVALAVTPLATHASDALPERDAVFLSEGERAARAPPAG